MAAKKETFTEEQFEKWIEGWIKKKFKKFEDWDWSDKKGWKKHSHSGVAGSLYFVGFIGALIYFLQQATSFVAVVTGFIKAMVWPGFLIYNLFKSLSI